MRIALGTIEVPDDWRRAIAQYYGEEGLASRDTCRRFIVACGTEDIHLTWDDGESADEDLREEP